MGEGSVITGRFLTRQVDEIARVEIRGADGTIETLEGTCIHPIWSLDRNEWVPLGELEFGEHLSGQSGAATVLQLTIANLPTSVYNIEVHGEHVYQAGALGVLVHNACNTPDQQAIRQLIHEATLGGRKALSHSEARSALELAKQAGLTTRASIADVTGAHWIGPHIHINGVGISHIRVLPGLIP